MRRTTVDGEGVMRVRSARRRVLGSAVVLAATLAVAAPGVAWAEQPVSFGSSPIVDTVGALGGRTGEVEAALADATERSGRQLFVVYVSEFSDPADATEWAAQTAQLNGLGDEDYLLAVAIDGRQYRLDSATDASVDADAIDRIASDVVEPRLIDEDWAGAAIAAADAIADEGTGGGGSGWIWLVVLLIVIAIVVVVILLVSRRRRKTGVTGPAPAPPKPIEELRREAGSALVQSDDAVRASEEELGFAVASYGEAATAPFQAALDTAKQKLAEAFTLQQRLDDADPDTDEERRAWYGDIIRLADEADAVLDEQAEDFAALRALEQDLPAQLARVEQELAAAEATLAPADTRMAALVVAYAPSAVAAVADNTAQARDRLAFARTAIESAKQAQQSGKTGEAAVALRAAEEAGDQSAKLATAVESLAEDLAKADASINAAATAIDADVATARSLPDPELAGIADRTAAELASIRAAAAASGRDPAALAARLQAIDQQIDAGIAHVRGEQEAATRAARQLDAAVEAARSRIAQAEQYIASRRGAVGAEARTRLSTASQQLDQSLSFRQSDPAAALVAAQRASSAADAALQLASTDVGGSDFFGGYGGGGTRSDAGGGDVLGALLGGIITGSVLSGGGGRRGGGGGGFGGFGGGGGFSVGGFGGGSRRSSGGGFGGSRGGSHGGGGRRSSGGRF